MNNPALDNICPMPFYEGPDQTDIKTPRWDSKKDWAFGQVYPFIVPRGQLPSTQVFIGDQSSIDGIRIYNANTMEYVGSLTHEGTEYSIEHVPMLDGEYMLVIYTDPSEDYPQIRLAEGRYFLAVFSEGDAFWYSDVFTVADLSGTSASLASPHTENYIELEWWDDKNFVTDDGIVLYQLHSRLDDRGYKNRLYVMSDIGMPDYQFDEEGESRDGYFFPFKQVSKKMYSFSFLAPEYLCDSLRLLRMADHVVIRHKGLVYEVREISTSFEWQEGGWLASVKIEFETNTVAKKIGSGIYHS